MQSNSYETSKEILKEKSDFFLSTSQKSIFCIQQDKWSENYLISKALTLYLNKRDSLLS